MKQAMKIAGRRWLITLKDFASPFIAAVAVIITALTVYWNYRVIDDLRFTTSIDTSFPQPDFDNLKLAVLPPRSLTFINSGTRTAAVLQINFVIFQSEQKEANQCPMQGSEIFEVLLEPFVVKPGEIIIQKVELKRNKDLGSAQKNLVNIALNPKMSRLVTCMAFDLVTPNNRAYSVMVPMTSSEYTSGDYGSVDLILWDKPVKLIGR
jgi:hypothetical protein